MFLRFAESDADERTWLALAEGLLVWATEYSPDANGWRTMSQDGFYGDFCRALEIDVHAALAVGAAGGLSAFADGKSVERLAAVISNGLVGWTTSQHLTSIQAVAAHMTACALDDIFAGTFEEWFRADIAVEVVSNRVYFVNGHNPKQFVGKHSVNTMPSRLPSRLLDNTRHLRLGDQWTTAYGLVIDYEHWHHLSPLSGVERLKIAAGQPNTTLAEYDIDYPTEDTIRNRGPADPARQHSILVNIVKRAGELGADVLVLPEYCLHTSWRNELKMAVDELSRTPTRIVAGTSEAFDGDPGERVQNHAWLMIAGGYGASQGKVFAAEMDKRTEGIATVGSVRVIRSEHWSVAVLICRDAMSTDLVGMLGRCGVNLLLVPAFSPRTGSIIAQAASLTSMSQAFVAVAVGPAVWTVDAAVDRPTDGVRAEAAFGGPYEQHPTLTVAPSVDVGEAEGRGLWVFDSVERTVRWANAD